MGGQVADSVAQPGKGGQGQPGGLLAPPHPSLTHRLQTQMLHFTTPHTIPKDAPHVRSPLTIARVEGLLSGSTAHQQTCRVAVPLLLCQGQDAGSDSIGCLQGQPSDGCD